MATHFSVGSKLQTKGVLKANNSNKHPKGAGYMKPRAANTIGMKMLPEANPPVTGTKGHHKEQMKHDQSPATLEAEKVARGLQEELELAKSETKKEREAKDRHESRQGFAEAVPLTKHQLVQEELMAEAALHNDILDELHEQDKHELEKKKDDNENDNKMSYAEYEKHVQKNEMGNKKQERQVTAPQLKKLKRSDTRNEEDYMKVQQQRIDFNNDCLNQSKNSVGGAPAAAGIASVS
ncbi:hypothetical protein DIPPA_09317 [Diplonema papillatum]|nr:hypothetical protein DIPPA_09317 [Diplonema papillatum]